MTLKGVGARILADNIPVLYDFYTKKLGFRVFWGDRNGQYAAFTEADGTKPVLEIFAKSGMRDYADSSPLPDGAKTDQAVFCTGADDVDDVYEELKAKGIRFMGEPQNVANWEMRCVYFRDPEGNLFEISGPTK